MANKKTSAEWLRIRNKVDDETVTIIYEPDGWDRANYHYSFNVEKISKEEFNRRLSQSTVIRTSTNETI